MPTAHAAELIRWVRHTSSEVARHTLKRIDDHRMCSQSLENSNAEANHKY